MGLYAQLNSDFVNEYGDLDLAGEIRTALIRDCDILSVLKGIKELLKNKCGVVTKKMVSEIMLHLASEKQLIPLLVSNVRV